MCRKFADGPGGLQKGERELGRYKERGKSEIYKQNITENLKSSTALWGGGGGQMVLQIQTSITRT